MSTRDVGARDMVRGPDGPGYTVLVDGRVLASDVPFEVAVQFVGQGRDLDATGTDHDPVGAVV